MSRPRSHVKIPDDIRRLSNSCKLKQNKGQKDLITDEERKAAALYRKLLRDGNPGQTEKENEKNLARHHENMKNDKYRETHRVRGREHRQKELWK